jgi:hypothetical protein
MSRMERWERLYLSPPVSLSDDVGTSGVAVWWSCKVSHLTNGCPR